MEIVITTPKTFISVKDGLFLIKTDEQKVTLSPEKISKILLTTRSCFTTDVLALCVKNNIDVVLTDLYGNPLGRFWHSRFGSTAAIRRKQLAISDSRAGLIYACNWINKKLSNQIDLIQLLAKNRPDKYNLLNGFASKIETHRKELLELDSGAPEYKNQIMGLEGVSAVIYFNVISSILPENFRFNGRSRQPAQDIFNACLNYAYGILYGQVEKAMIIAGLDPYIGFLHSDNYNKKSLVFDLIEPFRIYADETVVHLFTEKKINLSMADQTKKGVILNQEGKKILIQSYNHVLDKIIPFGHKKMKKLNTIQAYCHQFANELLKEGTQ